MARGLLWRSKAVVSDCPEVTLPHGWLLSPFAAGPSRMSLEADALPVDMTAPHSMDSVYIAVELVIAVLSIVGNVLVCWAVAINSTLKNATNYFLVSLAVADIAVGLLAIPFAIVISIGLKTDFHCCLFLACFVLVLTQGSIFSLLAVAVDRYKSLVTGKRARGLIAILWILSFGIGLTPLMGWNRWGTVTKNCTNSPEEEEEVAPGLWHGSPTCLVPCLFEIVVPMSYMVYFNFFGCVLLPLVIMLGIYIKIFMVACKQLRQMELMGNSRTTLQREVNAAKSLAIIVGLFALCWLPLHILNCLTLFRPDFAKVKPDWVMNLTIILSHANSVVNPIIYAYRIRDFRYTFRKILSRYLLCKAEEFPKYPKKGGGGGSSRQLAVSNLSTSPAFL
ncbi:adenosine receptor A2b isoform X2 [Sceloporus undulatus]|uniref:adenosine receptor A2b isoform X2 n=1 Tax=Sceloporus undulatus TaxID=8520 RepID=UPI001C4B9000|nr:adenosine receptor A2b isoform X2 [Sceloporus undulatus]